MKLRIGHILVDVIYVKDKRSAYDNRKSFTTLFGTSDQMYSWILRLYVLSPHTTYRITSYHSCQQNVSYM